MGRVIYTLNVALDGFVETPERPLDWGIVYQAYETANDTR
jgi:hypothetical protein